MHEMITKIPLEALQNTRDLGGISASDGKKIKHHRLIRSGRLSPLTENDRSTLYNEYNLRTIVDFRTGTEVSEAPDGIIDGVEYIHLPVVEEALLGITKEKSEGEKSFASLMEMLSGENFLAEEFMASIYAGIISSEYARGQYRRFLEIVLNHGDGSVLWHCSAGKDRVGTVTAILLSALGVPRENIICDYLMTNEFTAEDTQRSITAMRHNGISEKVISGMMAMHRVEESYIKAIFDTIDSRFNGIDSFLKNEMGLGDAELSKLRSMYLE